MGTPMPVPPTMPPPERKPPPLSAVSSGVRSGLARQSLGRLEAAVAHDGGGWLVLAFTFCVLSVGWAGVFAPAWNASVMLSGGSDATNSDEPLSLEADTAPEPAAEEETTPENTETAAVEEIPEDVPLEEVFEVPDSPDLVTVQRVAEPEPVPERPRAPSPRPASRSNSDSDSRPTARPAAARPSSSPGGGTGSGISQGAGSGKKAKTPQPPYPGFARSGRMSGTVLISILVDASGSVISANVVRSCGFPHLDSYASSYIRSRWHWPEGGRRTFTQPVSFRLK